jgi:Ca2+-binding EF-hand superfamily protein
MSLGGELSNLVRKTFDLYDDDRSGWLDPYELQLFLDDMAKIFKIPKLNPRQYQWALKSFDADGSGTIEFDELFEGMGNVIEKLASGYLGDEHNDSSSSDDNPDPQSPSKQHPDETPINNPKYIKNLATKIKLLQRINNKKELKIEKRILHNTPTPNPLIPEDSIDQESPPKPPSRRSSQIFSKDLALGAKKKDNSTFAALENLVNKKLTSTEKQKLELLEREKIKSWSENKVLCHDPRDPDDIDIDEYLRKNVVYGNCRPSVIDGFTKINLGKNAGVTLETSKRKISEKCGGGGREAGVGVCGGDNEVFLKYESGEAEFFNQK